MKSNRIKSIAIAAIACACMAIPAFGSAQRPGQAQDRWPATGRIQNYRSLDQMVRRAERESNEFRENFEHNYRGRDRDRDWNNGRNSNYGRGNNNGRWGNNNSQYGWWGTDLKSDIQKMDEAFERLRKVVARNDRYDDRNTSWRNGNWHSRDARREMETVVRYSNEIDRELGRGFGNWERGRRSLTDDWRDLKRDIDALAREFGVRSW